MQAILFDIDGVLYNAGRPVAGALQAVNQLQAWGIPRRFLTNTSTRSQHDLAELMRSSGVDCKDEEIIHPSSATAVWLRQRQAQGVALFVNPSAAQDFIGLPLLPEDAETGADTVVIGDMGDEWNFATLNRAFRLLHSNPQAVLVALGMTRYWHASDGLRLDVAPFVAALEFAVERKAEVLGKPAPAFFQSAIDALGLPPHEIVMIGDDVRTDVGAAQAMGLYGILACTGKFRPGDLELGVTPDAILDSVADLPQWWRTRSEMA